VLVLLLLLLVLLLLLPVFAGSLGGTIEACCLQPIDVIKTRLQLDKAGKYKGELTLSPGVARSVLGNWASASADSNHVWCVGSQQQAVHAQELLGSRSGGAVLQLSAPSLARMCVVMAGGGSLLLFMLIPES
jgi:hypothetical protein